MKITQVKLGTISVPLRVPFKTALRTVDAVNDVIVEILTDTGEKGYNYRSERFFNRLKHVPVIYKVFQSRVHGDPATPVFQSYTGERVMIRLLMPADKPRNISFVLHGHRWRAQPDDQL